MRTELRLERARGGPAPGRRRRYHGHARLRTCARPRPRPSSAHQAPGPRAPAEPEAPGAHCPPSLRPPGPAGLQRATWWGVRAPAESHPGEDAARGPARPAPPSPPGTQEAGCLAVTPLPPRGPSSSTPGTRRAGGRAGLGARLGSGLVGNTGLPSPAPQWQMELTLRGRLGG